MSQLVLRALAPAALESSLNVAEALETERQPLPRQWQQRLERARYEAERAARQYQAVEPEHRLVARTLEHQWEQALLAEDALTADYQRVMATQPPVLSATERAAIRRLASDIPAVWQASTTTHADRPAMVRQRVERVIVTVEEDSEKVAVPVHWVGGHQTHPRLIRPVARREQLRYYPALLARVAELHQHGLSGPAIAAALHDEGWRPAQRCHCFSAERVGVLLRQQGLRCAPRSLATEVRRHADELTLPELAHRLALPQPTL